MRSALSIAGFDSSDGAGLSADLKTFSALGVRGSAVCVCLTAQTGGGVRAAEKTPTALIDAMFAAAVEAGAPDAAKTGMLFDEETVITVCRNIRDFSLGNIVADPVMKSSSGSPLLTDGGVEALKEELLPLCDFVTPNTEEAGRLCGGAVESEDDMEAAARAIGAFGARAVIITGGHLPGSEVCDLLFSGGRSHKIRRKREGGSARGTGCVFSSALCAFLARGLDEKEAVAKAGDFVSDMIRRERNS